MHIGTNNCYLETYAQVDFKVIKNGYLAISSFKKVNFYKFWVKQTLLWFLCHLESRKSQDSSLKLTWIVWLIPPFWIIFAMHLIDPKFWSFCGFIPTYNHTPISKFFVLENLSYTKFHLGFSLNSWLSRLIIFRTSFLFTS